MRQPRDVLPPCGLIQITRLTWDKSARGGEGARNRNGVPRVFEVPRDHLLDVAGQLHVEESHWGSANAFAAPVQYHYQRVPIEEGYRFGCLSVFDHSQGLRAKWDGTRSGAPNRWFLNPAGSAGPAGRKLIVQMDQWVQVCQNGRFTCIDTGGWWYEQVTVNVAWFSGEPLGRIFVESQPTRKLHYLADLW